MDRVGVGVVWVCSWVDGSVCVCMMDGADPQGLLQKSPTRIGLFCLMNRGIQ